MFDYAQGQKEGIRRKPEPDGVVVSYGTDARIQKKNACISEIQEVECGEPEGMQALRRVGVLVGIPGQKNVRN